MVAANRISQRVAHSSTRRNAGELIVRVRDGYGRQPHRYGRLTLSRGIEPRVSQSQLADVLYVRSSVRLDSVSSTSESSVSRVTVRMNDGFELLVLVG